MRPDVHDMANDCVVADCIQPLFTATASINFKSAANQEHKHEIFDDAHTTDEFPI